VTETAPRRSARAAAPARVIPGCEAFRFEGGDLGALVLHGFTGNPTSMRPVGEYLASHGMTVIGPRYPGHGTSIEDLRRTRWPDWVGEAERALDELRARCRDVVVVALSFGASVGVHLAATSPDRLRGLAFVNPHIRDKRLAFAKVGRLFMRTYKGVGNDIKKPGQNEEPYPRIPMPALASMAAFQKLVRRELPSVRLPVIVFHSPDDHVVPPDNARLLLDSIGSPEKELVILPNSYHVATLDYDAETILDRVLVFARDHATDG